jgi:hypothetical protein
MDEKNGSKPKRRKTASNCQVVPSRRKSSFRVISQIILPTIRSEKAIVLTECDWRRIKAEFEELRPIAQVYEIAGSILAGTCVSFLCLCCSFMLSAVPVAGWLWALGESVVCTSGLTSAACFLFHFRLDAARKHRQKSLSVDLDQIGARFAVILETAND